MSTSSVFQWQTEAQHKLHQQMVNLLGSGPAALYYDAHRILAEKSLYLSTTHLVAHLLREIESSLRRVLLPYNYPSPTQCPRCHHKPEEEQHKKQIEAIASIYSLDETTSAQWVTLATGSKEHEHGFAAFAHRDALTVPRLLDEACWQMMATFEQVLVTVLDAFARQSLHVYKFLDELLAKQQPGKDDVSKLKNKIPANWATYSYFFSRLENPLWLRPLSQKNAFAVPAEDAGEGYLRYSPWPQAIYLKKMASRGQEVQEQVLGILVKVANTNNPLAQQSFLEIAQLLPAYLSLQLTPFVNTWIIEYDKHSFVSVAFQQFIAHLVQSEQIVSAMALFKALLLAMSTNDPYVERWDYEHLLFDPLPTFVMKAPREFLDLLCTLLDQDIYQRYIRFRNIDAEDAAVYERARGANTITWLPTFDVTEHMHVRGTQSLVLLAIALRKAAEQAINNGGISLSEILSLLDTYRGKVFKRLSLYLLSQSASTNLMLARDWLMTHTLFDDTDLRYEYILLAQVTLPHLTKEEQVAWFQWIEEGPDLEAYKQWHQKMYQSLPRDNDIQQFKAIWRRDWFGRIEKVLLGEWHARYDELVAQYGAYEPELHLTSWPVAMRTPSQDALLNMTVEQWLQNFVTSRNNQGDLQADALCTHLTSLISEVPERFANQVHLFERYPPEVIKAVIRGLVQAAQLERPFDWYQVLCLCEWIIEQRMPSRGEEKDEHVYDSAWASACFEMALLILTAFEKLPSHLPYASRRTIWHLLTVLADDPYYMNKAKKEMTPQYYFFDAINSTKGLALQAVISYTWWVMNHWKEEQMQQEKTVWDLSYAPEVRDLLERELSGSGARSPITYSVCARSLIWLVQLDESWTVQYLNMIFPHSVEDHVYYEAAWTTYLFQHRLMRRVFMLINDEYMFAINRLQRADEQKINLDTPNYYLARHLLIAYWHENITLEAGRDSQLSLFFQRASGLLRQSFITQVGQVCTREQPIDPHIIERFQQLWEWRVAAMTQSHLDPEAVHELAAFSWWMACESFPAIWAIHHLDYVLSHVDNIEMSSSVVCRFTECIIDVPLVTLRCIDRLVRGTVTNWGSKEWKVVETLLATALQQKQQDLDNLTEEIISYLAIHGHTDLLKLLS